MAVIESERASTALMRFKEFCTKPYAPYHEIQDRRDRVIEAHRLAGLESGKTTQEIDELAKKLTEASIESRLAHIEQYPTHEGLRFALQEISRYSGIEYIMHAGPARPLPAEIQRRLDKVSEALRPKA